MFVDLYCWLVLWIVVVDRLLAWDFVYLVCACWLFTEFCWFVVFSPGNLVRGCYLDVDCVLVIVDLVLDCVALFIGWGCWPLLVGVLVTSFVVLLSLMCLFGYFGC